MKLSLNQASQISRSFILTSFTLLLFFSVNAKNIYVSRKGNDNYPGTNTQPLKTIQHAKKIAYNLIETGTETEVVVWLTDEIYELTEPIVFKPIDLLSDNYKITFKAEKDVAPVISGGIEITNWQKMNEAYWVAGLPKEWKMQLQPRELFIDGKRAIRARFPNDEYLRVKQVGADRRTNFFFESGEFPVPQEVQNIELVLLHDWSVSRIAVKEIITTENKITAIDSIGAKNPAFFNLDHWEPNPRYYLENSLEFLDADFEWYFDNEERRFYVKLPENTNPNDLQMTVPVSEGLISFAGQENLTVKNIHFEGITFKHSKWEIPKMGYCGVQACHFDSRPAKNGWDVVPAAVYAEWSENCTFSHCSFENLGTSGLWFSTACKSCSVIHSDFNDISGNGIMIGEGRDRLVNGKPWWQEAPEQVAVSNSITNCSIGNCGTQFYGAVGIWCGLTAKTTIKNNEVFNLPYTGISIGWMWSPVETPCRENTIDRNHIYNILQILSDGGGIYMLGLQPESKLINNHIHDVKINAGRAESNGMFLDEGTTDVVVENNLIYNIAKSPLRFHKATTNLVKDNYLFCSNNNPAIRYNRTEETDIQKVDNKVFNEGEENYTNELETAIKLWKIKD